MGHESVRPRGPKSPPLTVGTLMLPCEPPLPLWPSGHFKFIRVHKPCFSDSVQVTEALLKPAAAKMGICSFT